MASPASLVEAVIAWCIPPPETRTPWTLASLPLLAVPGIFLVGSAYIRLWHSGTPLPVRILYALLAMPTSLRAMMSHYTSKEWMSSDGVAHSLIHLDLVIGIAVFVQCMHIIEFLFLGEESDFEIRDVDVVMKAKSKKSADSNGGNGSSSITNGDATCTDAQASALAREHYSRRYQALARPRFFPGTIVPLEFDIMSSVRGLGYGRGLPQATAGYRAVLEAERLSALPARIARAQKWKTVRRIFAITLKVYVVLDVCESIVQDRRIFPAAIHHGPATLRVTREGVLGVLGPPTVTMLSGIMILAGIQYVYGILYLVTAISTSPQKMPITRSRFEPWQIKRPLESKSIRDLWSSQWHALFRRCLVVCGYQPVRDLSRKLHLPSMLGRALATLAAFALSGLAHEMCLEAALPYFMMWDENHGRVHESLRTASRGYGARNFAMTRFFLYQACGIIFEEIWVTHIEPALATLLCGRGKSATKSIARAKPNYHTSQDNSQPVLVGGKWRDRLGLFWTLFFMAWTGQDFVEVIALHGCFGAFGTPRIASNFLNLI